MEADSEKARDYAKEYRDYHAKPEQKKNRAKRNAGRRKLGLKKGDGKEVDHKKPLSKGGGNGDGNLRSVKRDTNRKKGDRAESMDRAVAELVVEAAAVLAAEATLYWVYAWNKNESQKNFDTTTKLKEAKQMAKDFILDDGFHHVYIHEGTEDGPDSDRILFYAERRGRGVRIQVM